MSESRNHLRSVSDLYAADEIEVLLLEEIRDLEPPPTAYSKPEDIQDFEIGNFTCHSYSYLPTYQVFQVNNQSKFTTVDSAWTIYIVYILDLVLIFN